MDQKQKKINLIQMDKILTDNGINFHKGKHDLALEEMKANSISENNLTYEKFISIILLTYSKKPDVNMYDTKIPSEILNYTQGGGLKIEIDQNIVEQMK